MLPGIQLKKYTLRVFNIREEEFNKTFLLQLNIFLIITTLLVIKPTVNSLFLSELSASALPAAYILTAIVAIFGSYFYNKALERFPLNKIIEGTLLMSILSLILFGFAFFFDIASGFFLYIPYVWVAIFGLLTASQFWILANLAFNIRAAKRVFGFIGAGAIAGGIFGGYLTTFLTTFLETESLLFVAAFILIFCLPITRYIWKKEVLHLNDFQLSKRITVNEDSVFSLIKNSRLLSLIAIVIGLSVLVAKLVDYQYSDFASRFIDDPDELTAFFGFWFSTLSVVSLLIQLFLTQRIVGTFGVGKSLLWLPAGILIGSVLLMFFPQLWVIVFIKVIDGGLKQSVNKAATELLSIPIPIEIKKKTKSFTDVVVDSIATGVAGLVLIFFVHGLKLSSTYISIIIIVLISFWIYFIYKLRKAYIVSFKNLIEEGSIKKFKSIKNELPVTSIIGSVTKVFQQGSTRQVIHMLQKTLEVKDERFFYPIQALLKHESPEVKALAIENLYFLASANLCSEIEGMIYDKDQQVTTSAFRYLLNKYEKDVFELFDKYLNINDETISNAALIGLSLELRNNAVLQEKFDLKNRIKNAISQSDQLIDSEVKMNKRIAILEAIGNARVNNHYNIIEEAFGSGETRILKAAITNSAKSLEQRFVSKIVMCLKDKELRNTSTEALLFYGEPIINVLKHHILFESFDQNTSAHLIRVIEKFSSQRAIDSLMKLTEETEHSTKIEAIEAIKRLKWKYDHLIIKDRYIIERILDECSLYQNTLAVIYSQKLIQETKKTADEENEEIINAHNGLIQLLEQRMDRQLQRIFKLLGVKYPPEDVDPILNIILTGKDQQRFHAIEFLDNLLNYELRKELMPIAETILIENSSDEKVKKLHVKILSEYECLSTLLKRKDNRLKQAVLFLIEKLGNKKYLSLVESLKNDTNEMVRKKALKILNQK